MASKQATVLFDGVNLDNCLKQGLTITGNAGCPYCKQTFSFHLYLHKRVDTWIAGETLAPGDEDSYDICIRFSGNTLPELAGSMISAVADDDDKICVPCRGCNPHCPKLLNR